MMAGSDCSSRWMVHGGFIAILLGLLGRRVIAWFAPLRSANPNEASYIRLQPTTISEVFAVQLCSKVHTPHKNGCHAGLSTSIASL